MLGVIVTERLRVLVIVLDENDYLWRYVVVTTDMPIILGKNPNYGVCFVPVLNLVYPFNLMLS